jgi:uncharacterized membrane protein YedE/YeeE
MSGYISHALKIDAKAGEWEHRIFYIFGLLTGGWILNQIPQFAQQAFNGPILWENVRSWEYLYFAIVGLLLGFGTNLGSGCTSGHMLCGLSRLSLRSFVAVCTFCGTALFMVKAFGTRMLIFRFYGMTIEKLGVSLPDLGTALIMVAVAAFIFLSWFSIWNSELSRHSSKESVKENSKIINAITFLNGLAFALGLGFSGMTKPQKVLGFFDFGMHWDPSLACVIVFAILPATVVFQAYILKRQKDGFHPTFAEKWHTPTSSKITIPLVGGAILFGIGWGLLGICPGPLLVLIPRGGIEKILIMLFVAIGVYLFEIYDVCIQKVLPHDK